MTLSNLQEKYQVRNSSLKLKNETDEKWRRSGIIKHHIVNRCRGGKSTPDNLLRFEDVRAPGTSIWQSDEEVAELLQDAKRKQSAPPKIVYGTINR